MWIKSNSDNYDCVSILYFLTKAGQSCEVETLTPLIHRCNKLVLVGDPKQLPPTVISVVCFFTFVLLQSGRGLLVFCFGGWASFLDHHLLLAGRNREWLKKEKSHCLQPS